MSYVRLTQCKNVDDPESWSRCFTIEGCLIAPLRIGGFAIIDHTSRNGTPCVGTFRSGRILDYDAETGYFMDQTGVYHLEVLEGNATNRWP